MKYLSASALNITEAERTALIKVKNFFKRIDNVQKPKTKARFNCFAEDLDEILPAKFNMQTTIQRYDCGTAMCIGGWMAAQMLGVRLKNVVKIPPALASEIHYYVTSKKDTDMLGRLFFPKASESYASITTTRAIEEITRFLTTGEVGW